MAGSKRDEDVVFAQAEFYERVREMARRSAHGFVPVSGALTAGDFFDKVLYDDTGEAPWGFPVLTADLCFLREPFCVPVKMSEVPHTFVRVRGDEMCVCMICPETGETVVAADGAWTERAVW